MGARVRKLKMFCCTADGCEPVMETDQETAAIEEAITRICAKQTEGQSTADYMDEIADEIGAIRRRHEMTVVDSTRVLPPKEGG